MPTTTSSSKKRVAKNAAAAGLVDLRGECLIDIFATPDRSGNIAVNFLSDQGDDIDFHITVRKVEPNIILNDRHDANWGREVLHHNPDIDFESGVRLRINFSPNLISLNVDDLELIVSDDRFSGKIFNYMKVISGGGVGDIAIGGIKLSSHLFNIFLDHEAPFIISAGPAHDSYLRRDISISVGDSGERLNVTSEASEINFDGNRIPSANLTALIPGYSWTLAAEGADLKFQLLVDGSITGDPLIITRKYVIDIIEAKVGTDPSDDIFTSISILEHAKYSNIIGELSVGAIEFLRSTVHIFGLGDFLQIPSSRALAPELPAGGKSPRFNDFFVRNLREQFGQSVADADPAQSIEAFARLYAAFGNRWSDAAERFIIQQADHFCQIGRFDDLFHFWLSAGGKQEQLAKWTSGNWGRSLVLPFYAKLGEVDIVKGLITDLEKNTTEWVHTACIAAAVHSAIDPMGAEPRPAQLVGVAEAFVKLVDTHGANYWGRAHCEYLINATLHLLGSLNEFPSLQQRSIISFAIRNYGFSSVFWDRWCERNFKGRRIELDRANVHFEMIQRFVEAADNRNEFKAGLDRALAFFEAARLKDFRRIRNEVLGMPNVVLWNGAVTDGALDSEALIRHLAFPGAAEVPQALSDVSRRAVQRYVFGERVSETQNLARSTVEIVRKCVAACSSGDDAALITSFSEFLRHSDRLAGVDLQDFSTSLLLAMIVSCQEANASQNLAAQHFRLSQILEHMDAAGRRRLASDAFFRGAFDRLTTIENMSRETEQLQKQIEQTLSILPRRIATQSLSDALRADALFDCLVVIYSCAATLETKGSVIRSTWLADLKRLGIPYLFVVGGGDDTVQRDVLRLAVEDTYEFLPRKSIKLFQWVRENTSVSHVLKIDDDCYLDVEEFFGSLDFRRFNYFGRILNRKVGQKPRAWHMSRAETTRGRLELDKSPEPSRYADGGSGYALSRAALEAINVSLKTIGGQRLAQLSFSEDKLVGDLLAMQGVAVHSSGNAIAVFRQTHQSGHSIQMWTDAFYPGLLSGTQIVHADKIDLNEIELRRGELSLNPKRIWPNTSKFTIGTNSGGIWLVSDAQRISKLCEETVSVISVVRNEMFYIGHFLRHYRSLGVRSFIVVDNASDDGTLEFLLAQPDVVVFSTDTPFNAAAQGTDWKHAIISQLRLNKWSLVADSDEFLVYPGWRDKSLEQVLNEEKFSSSDAVRVAMLDTYPKGPLASATFETGELFKEAGYADRSALRANSLSRGSFGNQQTRTSNVRHRLMPGSRPEMFVAEKVPLVRYKPWMRCSVSMHYATGVKLCDLGMAFGHFKYNAQFFDKAVREAKRGQYFNGSEEYKMYAERIAAGRDVFFDSDISVEWFDCDEMRRMASCWGYSDTSCLK